MKGLLQDRHAALQGPHPVELFAQARHGPLGHRLEVREPLLRLCRLAVPPELLAHNGPIRPQPLGLARRLEHVPALGQRGLGSQACIAGLGQVVAIPLEFLESGLAVAEGLLGSIDRFVGDLETAGVLVTLGFEGADGLFEAGPGPGRALVSAADARLEPVAQCALVAIEVVHLFVANRRRGPEEGLVRDTGQVRDDFLDLARVRVDLATYFERDAALLAAEFLLENARPGHALGGRLVVRQELEADGRTMVVGGSPGSQRLEFRG